MAEAKTLEGMKVGNHQFRSFEGIDAAFGARGGDYPAYSDIPEEFRRFHSSPFNKAFSGLFFNGGKLADFGLSWKPGVNREAAMTTLRALMSSWDPKHEVKEATVAWCLSEWCDYTAPESKTG